MSSPSTPSPGPSDSTAASPDPATLRTSRLIRATPSQVFAAFAQPERLARWWGPKDFTNTFQVFEFRPGGRWAFVMHAPDGANYPNESIFREIVPDRRIVIEHVVPPHFRLGLTLTPRAQGTEIDWVQTFQSAAIAERFRAIASPANEQNLDRLAAELAAHLGGG